MQDASGSATGIYGLLAWLAPATDVMVAASHVTGLTPRPSALSALTLRGARSRAWVADQQ